MKYLEYREDIKTLSKEYRQTVLFPIRKNNMGKARNSKQHYISGRNGLKFNVCTFNTLRN